MSDTPKDQRAEALNKYVQKNPEGNTSEYFLAGYVMARVHTLVEAKDAMVRKLKAQGSTLRFIGPSDYCHLYFDDIEDFVDMVFAALEKGGESGG